MIKLGIIGTENTHALAFAKIINLPDPQTGKMLYPDLKVVGTYGPDEATAFAIVENANAEFVAKTPEELLDNVDAMFITNRKGSLHLQYALPFIEKGMPVFIDKPFTSCVSEAEQLVAAAMKSGSKLCGGSGMKLAYDVKLLAHNVSGLIASGAFVSATLNYAADTESQYDGFFFYSPHLTEMALAIFGSDVRSVISTEKHGSRISIWRYDNFDISLHYTKDVWGSTAVVYSKTGITTRNIDASLIYGHEIEEFVHMLRTGEMPQTYEQLVMPVRMIAAIEESAATGKEVMVVVK